MLNENELCSVTYMTAQHTYKGVWKEGHTQIKVDVYLVIQLSNQGNTSFPKYCTIGT